MPSPPKTAIGFFFIELKSELNWKALRGIMESSLTPTRTIFWPATVATRSPLQDWVRSEAQRALKSLGASDVTHHFDSTFCKRKAAKRTAPRGLSGHCRKKINHFDHRSRALRSAPPVAPEWLPSGSARFLTTNHGY